MGYANVGSANRGKPMKKLDLDERILEMKARFCVSDIKYVRGHEAIKEYQDKEYQKVYQQLVS